jgi:hypothetical protein
MFKNDEEKHAMDFSGDDFDNPTITCDNVVHVQSLNQLCRYYEPHMGTISRIKKVYLPNKVYDMQFKNWNLYELKIIVRVSKMRSIRGLTLISP